MEKRIADWVTEEGRNNTDNGSWVLYYDEAEAEFGVPVDKELAKEIVKYFDPEIVAEFEIDDECFDMTFYLDYCPCVVIEEEV